MTFAVLDEPDVAALPDAATTKPAAISSVTPLREALGLDPEFESGALLQAQALVDQHESSPVALARLAQAAQAAGDVGRACDAARAALRAAAAIRERRTSTHASHAAALVLAASDAPDAAEALRMDAMPGAAILRADLHLEAGDRARAVRELAGVESPLADALRGWLVVDLDPAAAVKALRAAYAKGLRSPDVLINLGYAFAAAGSLRKAIRTTREATLVSPYNVIAAHNLITYLRRDGQLQAALDELSRIAALLPDDPDLALQHAWAFVHIARDPQTALKVLRRARDRLWARTNALKRAEIEASVAYLEQRLGRRDLEPTKRYLWNRFFASGENTEVARLLASLLTEPEDELQLQRLLRDAPHAFSESELAVHKSRLACFNDDLDEAVRLAVQAADADQADTTAAGYAAYLVGEVLGDYEKACDVAERSYRTSRDPSLVNNLAFSLALAGRVKDAEKAIRDAGGPDVLPFHGATAALVDLAAGRVEAALRGYDAAVEAIRDSGAPELAELVDWRRRIAMVQLDIPLGPNDGLDEPAGTRYHMVRLVMRSVAARCLATARRPD